MGIFQNFLLSISLSFILQGVAFAQGFVSVDFLKYYSPSELQGLALGQVTFGQGVNAYKVVYQTNDVEGNLALVSGLIALPEDLSKKYPLLCYQHGTAGSKEGVPSRLQGDGLIGVAMAAKGYVMVAADYLGLGDHEAVHPYVHAASEAWVAVDAMRAMRKYATDNGIYLNDQVFLTGYSQGGHAAMALHRHLEGSLSDEFSVTAAAPMSGPYSVAEVMKDLIISGDEYGKPAYLINTFTSYQTIYGNVYTSIEETFQPPYQTAIHQFVNNGISLDDLNQSLVDSLLFHEGASIPLKIMEESYVEAVANDSMHPMRQAMLDNNVYDWQPTAPTRLYYCGADEEVPFQNSLIAEEAMLNNGALDLQAININDVLNHFFCALPASVATIEFFELYQKVEDGPVLGSEWSENDIKLFPNPAHDQLSLQNIPMDTRLFILDMQGRKVYERLLKHGDNLIHLNGIRSGLYFIELVTKEKTRSQKLIVR